MTDRKHFRAQTAPEPDAPPSKSQLKREMHALQDIGAALVALPSEKLARIELPERLLDAIVEAQRITSHEGKRRQMQYIGKLMRDVDPAPIQAVLDEFAGVSAAAKAREHRLERMRERVLADDRAVAEIAALYPGCDIQHLRQLRRNALKEQELGKPPRAFREIFRVLRELDDAADADRDQPNEPALDDDDHEQ